ncbi:hypothetical protein EGW08_000532 [Elysia chlorotica]|uniref:BTB domain-containing protein n=1 Tax=Elysia chlorotica TaxID=188477 RepID=A0A433UD17_ELYCH|nr:hypothetical protein EGW08_000532 [Elysia chlorotica]
MSTATSNARPTFQERDKSSAASSDKRLMDQDWRSESWSTGEAGLKLTTAKEEAAVGGARAKSGNGHYEKLNYSNSNNSNNSSNSNYGHASRSRSTEKICKIEVVRSCRKSDNSSGMAPREEAYCDSGASINNDSSNSNDSNSNNNSNSNNSNSNNNITCGQLGVGMRRDGQAEGDKDTKPATAAAGALGDSSNNNKAMVDPAQDNSCIVDNLVMDREKASPPDKGPVPSTQELSSRPGSVTSSYCTLNPEANSVSPEMTFADPRQSQVFQMLTGLQQLRNDVTFADVTVRVKDVDFRCHSFVLAINSPYLCAMLKDSTLEATDLDLEGLKISESGSQKNSSAAVDSKTPVALAETDNDEKVKDVSKEEEQTVEKSRAGDHPSKLTQTSFSQDGVAFPGEQKRIVVLKGFEPKIFSKMLDFMHCCFEQTITEQNCLELLLAASAAQMTHLRRASATFVTDSLSPANVFQVMRLCDSGHANLFEPRIMKRAHQVIRENFPQLSCDDDFLRLGRHVMIPLLADSMLHTRSEMDVLHALLRWVKARPEERCSDMTLMLQHVRFPLMSSRELEKLREVPLLKNNSLAMALIDESRAYGNLDYNERMAWPRHNSISRCLFSTRDLILWTADRDKGLHFYSIIDGQHHKVTSFGQLTATPASASSASASSGGAGTAANGIFSFDSTSSVCCYGDKIFFTGGEFNTDMVWSVDTGSGEVKVHSKMPRGRKFHSMVASKGCVYCLGGQDKRGYTVLEDVDAYIINKDMWVKVGHLAVPAYNMSAAVCGGAVYLVGGLDHTGQPLRLIQCFIALRSGLYSAFKVEVTNMPPSLLSARAVACGLDKTIYIVCGHGEVYQFEPDNQCLSHVTTLRNLSENPRVRFGLAYVGGCLVVIGGHRLGLVMHEPIRSVCLDIASKTEVRDYSPLLPGDIVNTCLAAKLSSNILRLFNE